MLAVLQHHRRYLLRYEPLVDPLAASALENRCREVVGALVDGEIELVEVLFDTCNKGVSNAKRSFQTSPERKAHANRRVARKPDILRK